MTVAESAAGVIQKYLDANSPVVAKATAVAPGVDLYLEYLGHVSSSYVPASPLHAGCFVTLTYVDNVVDAFAVEARRLRYGPSALTLRAPDAPAEPACGCGSRAVYGAGGPHAHYCGLYDAGAQ